MENFIDYINISNFKSIRDLKLEGLSRINLFIGKPNVGKSNILEALGVFSLPYLKYNSNKKITSLIRLENENEIFFDGNKAIPISLFSNIGNCVISHIQSDFIQIPEKIIDNNYFENPNKLIFKINLAKTEHYITTKDNLELKFDGKGKSVHFPLKSYQFNASKSFRKDSRSYLLPPNGTNLLNIIEKYHRLKKEVSNLFSEYNLKLVLDVASQELKIMKPPKGDEIFLIPYSSIADTLQRVIFHKTAIASNQNSVLIFEEPEAHAFPPYISHITQEIIDSKSNQFIISTHSPYVLNDFLENARDELSIFMVDYKNGETTANKLTKVEIEDIYQYGIDLFTNYETFLK